LIRGVIFDLDGTLLKTRIDFPALRREIGATHAEDIIEYMKTLEPGPLARAREILERHEDEASRCSELNDGTEEVLRFLENRGLPAAVFTRNSRCSLDEAERRFRLGLAASVCRNDTAPKPSPEPVFRIAGILGVPPAELLAVGDYAYDMDSALEAGALSVFLTNGGAPRVATRAHFVLSSLVELIPLIDGLLNGAIHPGPLRDVAKGNQ